MTAIIIIILMIVIIIGIAVIEGRLKKKQEIDQKMLEKLDILIEEVKKQRGG